MPYSKVTKGKDKGKYRIKRTGKVVSKKQMQAIEINKRKRRKK